MVRTAGADDSTEVIWPIRTDTYVDSRVANQDSNYGALHVLRVLVNNSASGDGSVTRALCAIPHELDAYDPAHIIKAEVWFYVWQDNTDERDIVLYPLTTPFVEGTGTGAGVPDGATWNTSDGTSPWSSPGGDVDYAFSVSGTKGTVLDADQNDRYFIFDITTLWTNTAPATLLRDNGFMLKIQENPRPSTGLPRAPFTSSDDLGASSDLRPFLRLELMPTVPVFQGLEIGEGQIEFAISDMIPWMDYHIESADTCADEAVWTAIETFSATSSSTNRFVPCGDSPAKTFFRLTR